MFPHAVLLNQSDIHWGEVIIFTVLMSVFVVPLLSISLYCLIPTIVEWWRGLFGPYNYYSDANTYNYNNTTKLAPVKTPKVTTWGASKTDIWGLYPEDRRAPPKATFFERVDNNERREDGPWEEIYLNARELAAWKNKKLREAIISNENNTKSELDDETRAFQEQYPPAAGYWG